MSKILKHPLFCGSILIAVTLFFAQKLELPFPNWMYFYVNDFLCMPIVLSLSLAILRRIKKTQTLYVPIPVLLALTTYFAVFFEWLMPQINSRYTSDRIDISLYFLGALLFYYAQKRLF